MTANAIPMLSDTDRVRFDAKVAKSGECWLWTGARSGSGYGAFYIAGAMYQAHRVAVRAAGYSVPTQLVVDHICRNRLCVNPEHLRTVDRRVNVHENSEALAHINSLKTHCPKGHPYSGANLIERSNGRRGCRTCKAEQQRARRSVGEADGGPVAESHAPESNPHA